MKLTRLTLAMAMLAAGIAHAQSLDAPALMQKYGCDSCHTDSEAITGPAYVDVADQYRGKPHAAATLIALMRKGAHGGGPWPMPPSPQVTNPDAERMVHYILALKK